jgi:hypothetical protein
MKSKQPTHFIAIENWKYGHRFYSTIELDYKGLNEWVKHYEEYKTIKLVAILKIYPK